MTDTWLRRLERHLQTVTFPAAKDELLDHLRAQRAGRELLWLVTAIPGDEYHFVSDVLSTARIALEMDIRRPWPERSTGRQAYMSDETLAAAVAQRLTLCPETNQHLIRVRAEAGLVYLEGRVPDVPQGVMATRVTLGVAGPERVVNRLQVSS